MQTPGAYILLGFNMNKFINFHKAKYGFDIHFWLKNYRVILEFYNFKKINEENKKDSMGYWWKTVGQYNTRKL